jgi:RimJ/RimL family protein N-acetyltransferase
VSARERAAIGATSLDRLLAPAPNGDSTAAVAARQGRLGMTVRLETSRLLLRPVRDADAIPTTRIMDGHVARYLLSWSAEMSVRECRMRIRAARKALRDREDVVLAIANRDDERLMGWISLARDLARPMRARLGYWIAAADEGRGHMTEAVEAFLPAAASFLGIRTIVAQVHPDNLASVSLLERQGFTLSGTDRLRFPASGRDEPVLVYRKTRPRRP